MTTTIGYGVSCYRRSLAATLRDRYAALGWTIEEPSLSQEAGAQGGTVTPTVFPMRAKPEYYPSDDLVIGVECCIDVSVPYQVEDDAFSWDAYMNLCADILHWADQDLNRWWARGTMLEPHGRRHLWRAQWADLVRPDLLEDCTEPPDPDIGVIESLQVITMPLADSPAAPSYTWYDPVGGAP